MDSNHDIVPTLRMFNGVMMDQAADEIERLRAELASRPAADESAKPVALFQFDERWKTWAQVDPNFASDPDVVPFYRQPAEAMLVLNKLVDAAEIHLQGGVAPLRQILDEASTLLTSQSEPTSTASKEAVTLSYPEELTPELREVLGRMCFQCISIAQCMRADGVEIAKRAEDEQATVLHWLTKFALKHGPDWRIKAQQALNEMEDRLGQRDASKAEGKS